jgi:hypothetical protein
LPINAEELIILGGKDEFGIPSNEMIEFNMKHMKVMPNDWHIT